MRRFIIDTDTASDDAMAVLMALRHPGVQVEALTICCGNVDFDQQVENALYTLEVAGAADRVPVYLGCRQPIWGTHRTVEYVHGQDGMGDSFFPKARQRPAAGHGVDKLIEICRAHPGEVTIVALAPLTNLATALLKEPSLAQDIGHIYFMGGTHNALGNVTPCAEYNVWVDPEAAKVVFRSGAPLTMIGWELAVRHSVLYESDYAEIAALDTPLSRFFLQIMRTRSRFCLESGQSDGTNHPDSVGMAIPLDPSVALATGRRYVEVETAGFFARGMTVVDELGVYGQEPQVNVVLKSDREKLKAMMLATLQA